MPVRVLVPYLVMLLAAGVLQAARCDDPERAEPRQANQENEPAVGGVRTGMPPARVVALLGKSSKISRQILFRRHVEQWTYPEPIALRIEFHGVRGQDAQVISVHSLRSKKP
jgi:hypothetical protein